jgi:hypothetical protein
VKSKKYLVSPDYPPIEIHTIPNTNLQQMYNILKKEYSYFKPKLPADDIKYTLPDNEECIVDYRYITRNHLIVVVSCEQGYSYIEIIEVENDIVVKIGNF